ncbi:telethonin [Siniperca chuatsi]|uniref:telethonin n=1 Tax=Siniperca chuatsi TaxID=119488 RepID=UPI001CE041CD|nr:telethonin [Siniperca chuatsi]XP_044062594.1 telethonin [Siniperca chuatsi]XP_044062595.1 telethonin [Siniperca chuatsi]
MHCVSRGGCYLVNSYCDLQEDNQCKNESYQACWLSLVLETRPQYKLTVSETDSIRRESYKQQQVVHFMVERSPSQTLRLGSNSSRAMTEHQLPFFNTSWDLHHTTTTTFGCTEQKPVILRKGGVDKQEVTAVTQDLSKPVRVNFRASSLMSSPREISHWVQRRE